MEGIIKIAAALTTADLETLIAKLSALRSTREPEVPFDPPMGIAVSTPDPRYWTERECMAGECLLGFRHPGFGWLWFQLPPHERDRLRDYLSSQSTDPAPQPTRPLN